MKIVRYFIHAENDMTGVAGFVPLWIPKEAHFDPGFMRGMVHDMLEHRLCDTGKFYQEAMAFGRLFALRLLPGVIDEPYGRRMSRAESLGDELIDAYLQIDEPGSDHLPDAPRTGRIDDAGFQEELNQFMSQAHETWLQRAESESTYDCHARVDKSALNRIANWLKIGYLDALRRYGGHSACADIGWGAFSWANQNESTLNRLNNDCLDRSVLRMEYDTDKSAMKYRVYEPSDERHGLLPDWLQWRVSNWCAGVRIQRRDVFA